MPVKSIGTGGFSKLAGGGVEATSALCLTGGVVSIACFSAMDRIVLLTGLIFRSGILLACGGYLEALLDDSGQAAG